MNSSWIRRRHPTNWFRFWQDLELSDFAIYCQGFAWPAHSCTVCYHSPTILAAFNYCKRRCKPESKPFVIIDEIDPRYLFSCLHFIYYGCKLYRPALFPRQGKGEGELDRPSGDFEYSMGSVFRTLLKQSVPRNDPLHTRTRDNQAAALILDNVQMFIAARILRIQDLMRACLFNVSAAIQYFLIELQLRDVEVIEDEYAYMQGCIGICLCLVYSQPDPGQFIELRRRLIRLMLHMKPSYLWSVVRKQDRFVFLNSFVAVHLDQAMRILSGSDQYETDGYKTDPGSDEPTFSDVADQLSKDPN
ncbi:hypothetical protein F4779DRAFT_591873 [Xylariaceae sp. FL0662B]|nr:hypothetical protein F4779DRAFT_591873 [Xylariaceae sp. FL0662B]